MMHLAVIATGPSRCQRAILSWPWGEDVAWAVDEDEWGMHYLVKYSPLWTELGFAY